MYSYTTDSHGQLIQIKQASPFVVATLIAEHRVLSEKRRQPLAPDGCGLRVR
jgi:hypothetical protein